MDAVLPKGAFSVKTKVNKAGEGARCFVSKTTEESIQGKKDSRHAGGGVAACSTLQAARYRKDLFVGDSLRPG